jgi:pimeloyl-[acyl-carrier protein] methyl ester esterase
VFASKSLYQQTIGAGTDLVLLHGFGFNGDVWLDIAEQLKNNFRITIFDLPGFGRSNHFDNIYNLKTASELILKNSPEQAIYGGWSLGGMLAMYIASHYPQRSQHLISIASTPKYLADNNWGGVSKTALAEFSHNIKTNFKPTMQRFIASQFPTNRVSNHSSVIPAKAGIQSRDKELIVTLAVKKNIRQLKDIAFQHGLPHSNALTSGINILQQLDLRNDLKTIPKQLHIYGEQDAMIPVSITHRLKQLAPQAKQHTIPAAGHAVLLTHAPQISNLIKEHCDEYLND